MSWSAVAQAVRPTARAVSWWPLTGVVTVLLVTSATARPLASGAGAGSLPMLAAALLAAVTVEAVHDPAARILAAVPVGASARGLVRIALVAAPSTAALVVLGAILPGRPTQMLLPALALVLSGLVLASWSAPGRGIHLAASIPVLWVLLDVVVDDVRGATAGPLSWWHTEPFAVSVAALGLLLLAGRR